MTYAREGMGDGDPSRYGDSRGDFGFWRERTHISLQPLAAPSVLGLFGLAAATFMVATNLAGWYGNSNTPDYLFPFVAMFGGLAQLLAGMWAYRARDTLATVVHGTWGSFWLGYGVLYLLIAAGVLTRPTPFVAFGYWFIVLAAVTWSAMAAASSEHLGLAGVLLALAAGATCLAIGLTAGSNPWVKIGAWLLIIGSVVAWYVATAMLLESTMHRTVLPSGRVGEGDQQGTHPHRTIEYPYGEPGVRVGQ